MNVYSKTRVGSPEFRITAKMVKKFCHFLCLPSGLMMKKVRGKKSMTESMRMVVKTFYKARVEAIEREVDEELLW